jgi:hypothetical protein
MKRRIKALMDWWVLPGAVTKVSVALTGGVVGVATHWLLPQRPRDAAVGLLAGALCQSLYRL